MIRASRRGADGSKVKGHERHWEVTMLTVYAVRDGGLALASGEAAEQGLSAAVWIDVVNPTAEDDKRLLKTLGIDIPTQDEMSEIEPSSRLYEERGALYLTALLTWNADQEPQTRLLPS